jgi:hypothetical protein
MKTFKQIQDEILDWMADAEDDGLLRDLVKAAINTSHRKLLTSTRWNFMLWPRTETITVTSGRKQYPLHPLFQSPLFFYNPTTDEYLEEIEPTGLLESEVDWQDGEAGEPERYMLTTVANTSAFPATAGGIVTVSTAGGTESSTNYIVVRGISDGVEIEENLLDANGLGWDTLTSTYSYTDIISIVKVGESWTRTITVNVGATQVLSLLSTEFGKQYRVFELLESPTASASVYYRFFKKPLTLSYDNDVPQIPSEYADILIWDTLLKMQGYARSTPDELALFGRNYAEAEKGLLDTYKLTRPLGARPTYIRYLPRV